MHSSHSWDGFRRRLSLQDSAGVGVREISDLLVPVVVTGFDASDQDDLTLVLLSSGGGAGLWNWAALFSDEPWWIEQVHVPVPGAGGTAAFFGFSPLEGLPAGGVQDSSAFVTRPKRLQAVTGPTAAGPAPRSRFVLSAGEQVVMDRPGILCAANVAFVLSRELQGISLVARLVVREA